MPNPRPIFTSFDEAWSWFADGGALTPIDEQREWFTHGRAQFLAFQAPLSELPVANEIAAIQHTLPDEERLILMDAESLHISILGVGYQVIAKTRPDEVLRQEVGRISELAARLLRGEKRIDVSIGPVNVFPDALVLEVHDPGARLASIRQALAQELGGDAFQLEEHQYLPHVTIAAFREPSVADVLRTALPRLREGPPSPETLRRIELSRWWFTGHDLTEPPERDVVRSYRLA